MTEAELLEIAQAIWGNVIALIALYLTILSGYLIVAYSVAADMTRSQVLIVNSLYLLVVIFLLLSIYTLSLRGNELAMLSIEMSTQRQLGPKVYLPLGVSATFVICTLASLKFMWDVRHPRK